MMLSETQKIDTGRIRNLIAENTAGDTGRDARVSLQNEVLALCRVHEKSTRQVLLSLGGHAVRMLVLLVVWVSTVNKFDTELTTWLALLGGGAVAEPTLALLKKKYLG